MQAKNLKGRKIVAVEILATGYVKLTLDDGTFVIVGIAFFGKISDSKADAAEEEEEEEEEDDEEDEDDEDDEDEEEDDEEEEDEEEEEDDDEEDEEDEDDEEDEEEDEDEELTWEDLVEMDEEELVELNEEESLRVKVKNYKTEDDLRKAVATALGITIPKKKKK